MERMCAVAHICPANGAPSPDHVAPGPPISSALEASAIQFQHGLRRVIKLEGREFADSGALAWLSARVSRAFVWQEVRYERYSAFVAAVSQKDLDRFLACDADPDPARRMRGCGELLGYPSCCTENYIEVVLSVGTSDSLQSDRELDRRFGAPMCPLVDRLRGSITHRPCAPNCLASAALGEQTITALGDPQLQERFIREFAAV
jgi:hypothetical protein